MDKDLAKRLLIQAGIPTARSQTLHSPADLDVEALASELRFPMFVKPANMGSSVGVSRATNSSELRAAVDEAFLYDRKIIIEESISGREIECAVLGNRNPQASILGEILPSDGFYSYDAKYV